MGRVVFHKPLRSKSALHFWLLAWFHLLPIRNLQAGDPLPSPVLQTPRPQPLRLRVERQNEGSTCGLHALHSIYRAHGLNGEVFRLRARLGIDIPALPFLEHTTGTLQPDLLRVLSQDGFRGTLLKPSSPDDVSALKAHLQEGFYAMALIQRPGNRAYHWVVLVDHQGNWFTVADSLYPGDLGAQPEEAFLAGQLLTAVAIRPDEKATQSSIWAAHRHGLVDMLESTAIGRWVWAALLTGLMVVVLLHTGIMGGMSRLCLPVPLPWLIALWSTVASIFASLLVLAWFGYQILLAPGFATCIGCATSFVTLRNRTAGNAWALALVSCLPFAVHWMIGEGIVFWFS